MAYLTSSAVIAAAFAGIILAQSFVLQNTKAHFIWVAGLVSFGEALMLLMQVPENTKDIFKCSILQWLCVIVKGTLRAYICASLLCILKELGPLFSLLFYGAFVIQFDSLRRENWNNMIIWRGFAVLSAILLYLGVYIKKEGNVFLITLVFAGLGAFLLLERAFEINSPQKRNSWQRFFQQVVAFIQLSIFGWLYSVDETTLVSSYPWILFPLVSFIAGLAKTFYGSRVEAAVLPFCVNEVSMMLLGGCFVSLLFGKRDSGDFIVMISNFLLLICSLKSVYCTHALPSFEPTSLFKPKGDGYLTHFGNAVRFFLSTERERKLVLFFLLTLAVMFLELIYGISANSLGLVSDSFHMLLDSVSIAVGLFAEFASSLPGDKKTHPFGYARYRVLGGFTNGVLLLFIALFVVIESVERLMCPPEINAGYLIHVAVVGLIVNIIGVAFFHGADSHSHSHSHGGCSSSVDHNLRGIYLHILADLVGSINVLVSSLLLAFKGWKIADPLCSLLSCVFIALSAFPLLEETGKILLLSGPPYDQEIFFQKAIAGIKGIEDVTSVENICAWPHSSTPNESAYCAIRLSARNRVDHNKVRLSVKQFMKEFFRAETGSSHLNVIVHIE